jgi:hypothetical protein
MNGKYLAMTLALGFSANATPRMVDLPGKDFYVPEHFDGGYVAPLSESIDYRDNGVRVTAKMGDEDYLAFCNIDVDCPYPGTLVCDETKWTFSEVKNGQVTPLPWTQVFPDARDSFTGDIRAANDLPHDKLYDDCLENFPYANSSPLLSKEEEADARLYISEHPEGLRKFKNMLKGDPRFKEGLSWIIPLNFKRLRDPYEIAKFQKKTGHYEINGKLDDDFLFWLDALREQYYLWQAPDPALEFPEGNPLEHREEPAPLLVSNNVPISLPDGWVEWTYSEVRLGFLLNPQSPSKVIKKSEYDSLFLDFDSGHREGLVTLLLEDGGAHSGKSGEVLPMKPEHITKYWVGRDLRVHYGTEEDALRSESPLIFKDLETMVRTAPAVAALYKLDLAKPDDLVTVYYNEAQLVNLGLSEDIADDAVGLWGLGEENIEWLREHLRSILKQKVQSEYEDWELQKTSVVNRQVDSAAITLVE